MGGLIHAGAWDGREYIGTDRTLLLFEPQPGPFENLLANLGGNPNATFVNAALGAEPGEAEMRLADPDYSSSLLEPAKHLELYPNIRFDGSISVKVTTLDLTIQGYGLKGVFDELVLDVQGYELEVLKGSVDTLKDIDTIVCEVNVDEVYKDCAQMRDIDLFLAPSFDRVETDLHGGIWGDARYERHT